MKNIDELQLPQLLLDPSSLDALILKISSRTSVLTRCFQTVEMEILHQETFLFYTHLPNICWIRASALLLIAETFFTSNKTDHLSSRCLGLFWLVSYTNSLTGHVYIYLLDAKS